MGERRKEKEEVGQGAERNRQKLLPGKVSSQDYKSESVQKSSQMFLFFRFRKNYSDFRTSGDDPG